MCLATEGYFLSVIPNLYNRMFWLFLADGTVVTTNTAAEAADVATELREA